ncbi:MAG: biosynthetic-type acetolactate synthase large subunit [Gemmatimonadetes bacterium]|nr:biosynthetic-type acetolactate synthase large subunit [Gemmatimonadota bacterium]MYG86330.1 biosynthetic-type acetolactate synthase large subunit [Gemmatimonadota bacterium]MYJ90753.1 biosynthetic-type acetolactate synthase large subunit [Gemmatimonadota bacterium]
MKLSGAEIVIECLKKEGVDIVFGYPGGVVIPTYDVIQRTTDLRHILVRHEQGATHMADGYARATGKPGVVLVSSGPGATNTVTGIATAYMDSIPMIVITGQVPVHLIGNDAFQESDTVGITRPITKHNFLIKETEDIAQVFAEAFHIATTGRPGPVLIDVPKDVQIGEAEFSYPERPDIRGYKPRTEGHPKQIRKAAEMLTSARKPVIYVGGGAIISEASEEIRTLARKLNAPVTTTLMGLGAYPENDPLSLKMLGMHGTWYANTAVMMCDLLVCIGARFDDRVTGKLEEFSPNSKKIHIDIDPSSLNKNVRVDLPIVGDVKRVLQQLVPLVERADTAEWLQQIETWKRDHPLTYANTIGLHEEGLEGVDRETVEKDTDQFPLCAQYAIERIGQLTKGEAYVVTDVGQHQMWAAQWYGFSNPRSMITSGGLGTMGFGLPAAIGAQFACPDREVIVFSGDGSIQMNIQEMATAVACGLPIKIVLLNNGYLGMVRQWQELFYAQRYSEVDLRDSNPDFVKLAEAYGAVGIRVFKDEDVEGAWLEACKVKDRPVMLDMVIAEEGNVYPMIPAGAASHEMIEE